MTYPSYLLIYNQLLPRKGQWFVVHKGPNFSTSTVKPETDLTVDMLTT
jgi:phenylalanyl-tRNA synthetase alpha chain